MRVGERNVLAFAMVAVFGVLAAACGSGSGSPTSPNASPTAASRGATIQGTVETGLGSSGQNLGVRAMDAGAGVRVSITGSSLSTTTDNSGHFVLSGVASGQVELRFEAAGVDARLQISGLTEGQSLTINVHLSGTQAFLVDSDDKKDEVTLRGTIEGISGSTLQVAGKRVFTDSTTQFLGRGNSPASLRDFKVGDPVEVEGRTQPDGSIFARKVKAEDAVDDEPGNDDVSFKGTIQGLSPLLVAGRTVVTDGNTRILDKNNQPIAFSMLKVGDTVEVEGTTQSTGSVLAKKIKLEN